MIRWITFLSGLIGAAGVAVGAYAAHGLEADLTASGLPTELVDRRLKSCEVAVRYHLIHAVAMLALAAAPPAFANKRRGVGSLFFSLGIAMFSGVLYAQSIAGLKSLNLVVPAGGLCFILGWLVVASIALPLGSRRVAQLEQHTH